MLTIAEIEDYIKIYLITDLPSIQQATKEVDMWLRNHQHLNNIHSYSVVLITPGILTVFVQLNSASSVFALEFDETDWLSRSGGAINSSSESNEAAYDRAMKGI